MTRTRPLFAAALLVLAAAACGRFLEAGAAVVNGVSIPQAFVGERVEQLLTRGGVGAEGGQGDLRAQLARRVVGELVQEELLRQAAARRGITVPDEEVSAQFEEIRARFPSPEQFQAALDQEGLTEEALRGRIRDRLVQIAFRDALIADDPVTAAEVRAFYERNRARYEEIRVRHILFRVDPSGDDAEALAKARDALERIRAGEDFATLATRLSEDPSTRESAGDLGTVRRGRFVPEFEEAAFALAPGRVSEPVRSQFGYHLILVEDKRVLALAEVRAEIEEELARTRGDAAFRAWLQEAIGAAEIRVNPRYGDWDPSQLSVVEHPFFVPALTTEQNPS